MLFRLLQAFHGGVILQQHKSVFSKIKCLIKDKRERKFFCQRFNRGFSEDETWSLDHTIAKFILPRLKLFRSIDIGYPGNTNHYEWIEVLDKMIFAMEKHAIGSWEISDQCESDKVREGTKLFGKWFGHLWW